MKHLLTALRLLLLIFAVRVTLRSWQLGAGQRRRAYESRAGYIDRVTRPVLKRARDYGEDATELQGEAA